MLVFMEDRILLSLRSEQARHWQDSDYRGSDPTDIRS